MDEIRKFIADKLINSMEEKNTVNGIMDTVDALKVAFFFSVLKNMKDYFVHLEFYDLWENRKHVAV